MSSSSCHHDQQRIRHAEQAFSIASRLAGRVIGPGTLPELAAPLETELCAVARAALVEGCIGETLAAVLALEQAQHASDGAIRATLLEVSEDLWAPERGRAAGTLPPGARPRATTHTRRVARRTTGAERAPRTARVSARLAARVRRG